MSQELETTITPSERFVGRVKWFNNKEGYGFVTALDGEKNGLDIFVHHTSIKVDREQYKYLVQGEYVEYNLAAVPKPTDGSSPKHEFNAINISGIKGGMLMCETHNEIKLIRPQFPNSEQLTEHRNEQRYSPSVTNSNRAKKVPKRTEGTASAPRGPKVVSEWMQVNTGKKNKKANDTANMNKTEKAEA